jgi:hypothetical protein
MAQNYQHLQKYKGSLYGDLGYSGIEYDFEVPDNMVISSPGGLSSNHHHYTKGMYGYGASQDDLYAGEGYRYPQAEHGNLYQVGQNAPTYMGMYPTPPDPMYTQNASSYSSSLDSGKALKEPKRDNFVNGAEIPKGDIKQTPVVLEAIPPPIETLKRRFVFNNPLVLVVVIILAYIALDFYMMGAESFVRERLRGGKPLDWKSAGMYAAILTVVILAIINIFDVPLIELGAPST